jgi:HSP20 family protein
LTARLADSVEDEAHGAGKRVSSSSTGSFGDFTGTPFANPRTDFLRGDAMKHEGDLAPLQGTTGAFRTQLDRLFEDFFGASWSGLERGSPFLAPMDVFEDREAVFVKLDLPGLSQKDVRLTLEGSRLTISGQRKAEEEFKEKQAYRVERRYGEFARSLDLPDTIDAAKVNATFKDGVLTVRLPKKPEARPKVIEIEAK